MNLLDHLKPINDAVIPPRKPRSESTKKTLVNVLGLACGILLAVLIPFFHIGIVYNLWSQYTRNVTRHSCSCSCWDMKFKANYETGIAVYKHVYVNATANSTKIWAITVIGACLLTDCVRRIIKLVNKKRLRLWFAVLFVLNVYPNYYSWWAFFNFWNDDYYYQWYHQLLFAATELISTAMVVHLMDRRTKIQPWNLIVILAIAIAHCFCALTDQFGYNVLRGEGQLHQILRDVGFMAADVLHVYLPLKELKVLARQQHLPPSFLISNKLFFACVSFVICMWIFNIYL